MGHPKTPMLCHHLPWYLKIDGFNLDSTPGFPTSYHLPAFFSRFFPAAATANTLFITPRQHGTTRPRRLDPWAGPARSTVLRHRGEEVHPMPGPREIRAASNVVDHQVGYEAQEAKP